MKWRTSAYALAAVSLLTLAGGCGDDGQVVGPVEYKGTEMIIVSMRDTVNNVVADRLQRISFDSLTPKDPTYVLDSAKPASTPRGGKIAYLVERPGDRFTIYVADIDGKNVKQIANATDLNRALSYPALSRDGKKVAYGTLDRRLIVSNVDGSDIELVSNNIEFEAIPDFSPDGKRIAFYGYDDKLYVANVDGTGERVLATGVQNAPEGRSKLEWSPDGTKIVYTGVSLSGQSDIYVVNADGDPRPVQLTNDGNGDADPAWSPNGDRIAWASFPGDVYVMNADGTGRKNLTFASSFDDSQPTWSPDGTRLAYTSRYKDSSTGDVAELGLLKVYNFTTLESSTVAFKVFRGFWGKF